MIRFDRDIEGRLMLMAAFRCGGFRAWIKPWAWPYSYCKWGIHVFGAGPIGCNYFPSKEPRP